MKKDQTSWKRRAYWLVGSRGDEGSRLGKFTTYFILTGMGFVFLYPLLYMISVSFMDTEDLVDATVTWIPTHLSVESFIKAAKTLDFWDGLKDSLIMTLIPAGLQTFTLALAGYGLARYRVPGKKFWMALAVFIFLVPTQVTMIPRFLLFNTYQMIGTIWPIYLISALGQGVKSSVFLLIYYTSAILPKSLDEAAKIDGRGPVRCFSKLPCQCEARACADLSVFLYLDLDEHHTTAQYSTAAVTTLPMHLQQFVERFNKLFASVGVSTGGALNESIRLAGTLLTILPLIILYFIVQKQFVESIERTGLTGE